MVLVASGASDANWPQFRGPGARGVADGAVFPDRWPATNNVALGGEWKNLLPKAIKVLAIGDRVQKLEGPVAIDTLSERQPLDQIGAALDPEGGARLAGNQGAQFAAHDQRLGRETGRRTGGGVGRGGVGRGAPVIGGAHDKVIGGVGGEIGAAVIGGVGIGQAEVGVRASRVCALGNDETGFVGRIVLPGQIDSRGAERGGGQAAGGAGVERGGTKTSLMPSTMATAPASGKLSRTWIEPLVPAAKGNRPTKLQLPGLVC